MHACVFADGLSKPRGVVIADGGRGDLLVLERGRARVVAIWDDDGDGVADGRATVFSKSKINHGLAVYPDAASAAPNRHVYASSDTTVYRAPFGARQRTRSPTSSREVVIKNMNADGRGGAYMGHRTRTLVFGPDGKLYISVGSKGNVDRDSHRSRIRRFTLADPLPSSGYDFQNGEVFADGLRNEVGLAFDNFGVLWGVENGADRLKRSDFGGDVHEDNPAEEFNRFPEARVGDHWGYPYCWTSYQNSPAPPGPKGTVWAWPSFKGTHSDAWCQANTHPPELAMQAHSAPLGLAFYGAEAASAAEEDAESHTTCGDGPRGLPSEWRGDAVIPFHGSWNRDVPTGYKVVRVPMEIDTGLVSSSDDPVDLVWHRGTGARWPEGTRFVDAAFDERGRLFVSSDGPDGAVALLHGGIVCGEGCTECCRVGRGTMGAASYCASTCRCAHGEGDCDRSSHCVAGTSCVNNVGETYGFSRTTDVCETTPEPTRWPSRFPSKFPSQWPTTKYPSRFPTKVPSRYPTRWPTAWPSKFPSRRSG